MIVGHIANLEKEKKAFAPLLQQGLEYLAKTDFTQMPAGRYEIQGDTLFALVQEYQPDLKANRKAETHVKYIDIQYIASGEEMIGYGLLTDENEVLEDKLAEKDAKFYKTVKNEMDLILTQGMYGVFFPDDVHRPCCLATPGVTVKKVVMKVKASTV